MAGVNMRLMNKTALDYSQLGVSQQQMLIVNAAINVTNYREGTLVVRVHGAQTITGDASIKVILVRTAPTEEDPSTLFANAEPGVVTLTVDADTVISGSGGLLEAALPSNFGGYLGLAVMGVMDATGGRTVKATISVDLNLKE